MMQDHLNQVKVYRGEVTHYSLELGGNQSYIYWPRYYVETRKGHFTNAKLSPTLKKGDVTYTLKTAQQDAGLKNSHQYPDDTQCIVYGANQYMNWRNARPPVGEVLGLYANHPDQRANFRTFLHLLKSSFVQLEEFQEKNAWMMPFAAQPFQEITKLMGTLEAMDDPNPDAISDYLGTVSDRLCKIKRSLERIDGHLSAEKDERNTALIENFLKTQSDISESRSHLASQRDQLQQVTKSLHNKSLCTLKIAQDLNQLFGDNTFQFVIDILNGQENGRSYGAACIQEEAPSQLNP